MIAAPFWGDYFWLSDEKILSWQREDNSIEDSSEAKLLRQYAPQIVWLDGGPRILLLDYYKSLKKHPFLNSEACISIDKKWMLWFAWPELQGPPIRWEAASLDQMHYVGGRFEAPPRKYREPKIKEASHEDFLGNLSSPIWRKDGLSWTMVRGTKQAPLFDLFSLSEQKLEREVKLPPVSSLPVKPQEDFGPYLLGYISGKMVLGFAEMRIKHTDKVEAFTLKDDGDPKSLHRFTFSLPQQGIYDEVHLSPNGDKLAWLVYVVESGEKSFNLETIRRQIWVSSWEGKHWKLIGDYQPQGEEKFPPSQIRWLTDENQISFLYQQKLWTVPTN